MYASKTPEEIEATNKATLLVEQIARGSEPLLARPMIRKLK
jgi:hypothetical protein